MEKDSMSQQGYPLPSLATISDLASQAIEHSRVYRKRLAEPMVGVKPNPLFTGTEEFTNQAINEWHMGQHTGHKRDVACYYIEDAIISGTGEVWLDGALINDPEIMPGYVNNELGIYRTPIPRLLAAWDLPVRVVDHPCLVATGWGIEVYGHFLIEMLFRILLAKRTFFDVADGPFHLLLDFAAPRWLLKILEEDLGFGPDRIEFYFPSHERVLLRNAYVPTRVFQDEGIHPFANELLSQLFDDLLGDFEPLGKRQIFVTRGTFVNRAAPFRIFKNEAELSSMASEEYGFVGINPETLPWRHQISIFKDAEIIIGQAGSGLHNTIFSGANTRVGSIGWTNFVQSEIGMLRGHKNAYFSREIRLHDEFEVDKELFHHFLARLSA